jgi:hypothetical protein
MQKSANPQGLHFFLQIAVIFLHIFCGILRFCGRFCAFLRRKPAKKADCGSESISDSEKPGGKTTAFSTKPGMVFCERRTKTQGFCAVSQFWQGSCSNMGQETGDDLSVETEGENDEGRDQSLRHA